MKHMLALSVRNQNQKVSMHTYKIVLSLDGLTLEKTPSLLFTACQEMYSMFHP